LAVGVAQRQGLLGKKMVDFPSLPSAGKASQDAFTQTAGSSILPCACLARLAMKMTATMEIDCAVDDKKLKTRPGARVSG
jgi:hypothetical protein